MLVLVDTNVLLRVVEPLHPHHSQAVAALRLLRQAENVLCLVPQIHYEFWVAATRPIAVNGLSMTPEEAEAELRQLGPPLFRFLRDERAIYEHWRELVCVHRVQGKSAHDARRAAAMQRHGVTHILTFNVADFRAFPGITVIDPASCARRSPGSPNSGHRVPRFSGGSPIGSRNRWPDSGSMLCSAPRFRERCGITFLHAASAPLPSRGSVRRRLAR